MPEQKRISAPALLFILSILGLSLTGCFYLAPLDQDIEEQPYPPTINMLTGTDPPVGMLSLNLNEGGKHQFLVSDFDDPNLDDTLYWRWIVDYGTMVAASFPMSVLPSQREDARLSFDFTACDSIYIANVTEGKTVVVYIVLSDSQFTNHGQSFRGDQIQIPFETQSETSSPIWASWTVQFKGSCPASN